MSLITCKECNQQVSNKAESCPNCGAKVPNETKGMVIGFVGFLFFLIIVIGFFQTASNPPASPPLQPNINANPSAYVSPKEKTPLSIEEISPKDLAQAIAMYSPTMGDFENVDYKSGTLLFIDWAMDHLKWSDLQSIEKSSFAKVMKDSETEIGKRICGSGTIIEIAADKSGRKIIYNGGLVDVNGHIVRFVAIGSSGDIVQESNATFCGVVTGRYDYTNSMNGTAHAIHLVGMFNLPENK